MQPNIAITPVADTIEYRPSHTGKLFHKDNSFVRTLIGPIGSGKSVACCWDIFMKACQQDPFYGNADYPNGIRKTRFVIIRNTYRELIDTTMQTWWDWFDKDDMGGKYEAGNLKHNLIFTMDDDTTVKCEIMFRALDRPDDIKKLLSLELTGGWINEVREIPKAVMDMLIGRLGRYPSKREGGASWWGLIMDTNPPDFDHWYYSLFEKDTPEDYAIFKQPSGLAPNAENIDNLPTGYYQKMQSGKTQEWINVYVHGLYGFISDGKPCYPEYNDDIHSTNIDYVPAPNDTIYIGIDFGLTPAAAIGVITATGQVKLIDEFVTFDMGAMNFGKFLKQKLDHDFPTQDIEIYGDPAGDQRAQTDEVTPFMVLQNQGLSAVPTYTNDPIIRREVVADYLQRLDFSGHPAFIICPKATMTRKAFAGGYKYKRVQVTGEQRFMDKPDKNKYSHISDAVQYLFLGAVGGGRVIGGFGNSKPLDYSRIERSIL